MKADQFEQMDQINALERSLNYNFTNRIFAQEALTLRGSLRKKTKQLQNFMNYERLELLGDSVLNLIYIEYLYRENPDMAIKDINEKLKKIVNNYSLSQFGSSIGIESFIIDLRDNKNSCHNSKLNSKITADVIESIVGAVFIDSGDFKRTQNIVICWMCNHLQLNKELGYFRENYDFNDSKEKLIKNLKTKSLRVSKAESFSIGHEDLILPSYCSLVNNANVETAISTAGPILYFKKKAIQKNTVKVEEENPQKPINDSTKFCEGKSYPKLTKFKCNLEFFTLLTCQDLYDESHHKCLRKGLPPESLYHTCVKIIQSIKDELSLAAKFNIKRYTCLTYYLINLQLNSAQGLSNGSLEQIQVKSAFQVQFLSFLTEDIQTFVYFSKIQLKYYSICIQTGLITEQEKLICLLMIRLLCFRGSKICGANTHSKNQELDNLSSSQQFKSTYELVIRNTSVESSNDSFIKSLIYFVDALDNKNPDNIASGLYKNLLNLLFNSEVNTNLMIIVLILKLVSILSFISKNSNSTKSLIDKALRLVNDTGNNFLLIYYYEFIEYMEFKQEMYSVMLDRLDLARTYFGSPSYIVSNIEQSFADLINKSFHSSFIDVL